MQVYNEDEVKDFKKKIAELENKLGEKTIGTEYNKAFEKLKEQNSRLHEELGIYKRDYQAINERNEELERGANQQYEQRIEQLEIQNKALKDNIDHFQEENRRVLRLNEDFQKQITELEKERDDPSPGATLWQEKANRKQEKIDILTAEKEKVEGELSKLRTDIAAALA